MELLDKVAIVTGGGTGIGRATALMLAGEGVQIVVCGRRTHHLNEVVEKINQSGGRAIAFQVDIRNSQQITQLVEETLKRFGKIHILINNAGVAIPKPLIELTESEWDETIETNLKSQFLLIKNILPHMMALQEGVIINISSILGQSGLANFSAYCASKFGIIGLTESLADELKNLNIRVYSVCPGQTSTEMQRQLGGENISNLSMPPEKIAQKILFLINEKNRTMSEIVFTINEQSTHFKIYTYIEFYKNLMLKLIKINFHNLAKLILKK